MGRHAGLRLNVLHQVPLSGGPREHHEPAESVGQLPRHRCERAGGISPRWCARSGMDHNPTIGGKSPLLQEAADLYAGGIRDSYGKPFVAGTVPYVSHEIELS